MTRAALYARVSGDAQRLEGTIESQIAELKRHINVAGHVLVKEYLDDGHTGADWNRPALEEIRSDLKTDVFDAIHFLDIDRMMRNVAHQMVLFSDLLKYGKQIVIKGRDYINNPENKFEATVLGAVAELERAKIIERTTRGRLYRLRMGELSSNGHRIYGYHYIKKSPTSPAELVINDDQAAIVRSIFEMFASARFGLVTISRFLEERRIPTRTGRPQWHRDSIKNMLKNETYAGTRYYNRITAATEANRKGMKLIRGRWVVRDRAEWIAIKVPPIVSQELFDTVQERLRLHEQRYCRPATHYLLQGLVQCGACGSRCSSSRRYYKVVRPSGNVSVYHRAAYRCNRRAQENMHDRTRIERCRNSEVGTHILEGSVFDLIREIMLDPARLRACIMGDPPSDDRSIARRLARIAEKIRALHEERRNLTDLYAAENIAGDDYIAANRTLDEDLERLVRKKAEIATLRSPQRQDFVDASVRQFCATAYARFLGCGDFDAKRQFLLDHIERVIYNRDDVTIVGSVPVQPASGVTNVPFRIEGVIDRAAVRANTGRRPKATTIHLLNASAAPDRPTLQGDRLASARQ